MQDRILLVPNGQRSDYWHLQVLSGIYSSLAQLRLWRGLNRAYWFRVGVGIASAVCPPLMETMSITPSEFFTCLGRTVGRCQTFYPCSCQTRHVGGKQIGADIFITPLHYVIISCPGSPQLLSRRCTFSMLPTWPNVLPCVNDHWRKGETFPAKLI